MYNGYTGKPRISDRYILLYSVIVGDPDIVVLVIQT